MARDLDLGRAAESALVLAARAGDTAAFTELVRRRQGWLRRLLRQLCGNAAEADDLAQESFLRAWARFAELRDTAALAGWLRRIAVNAFLQRRRRAELDASTPEEDVVVRPPDSVLDLERALAALSVGERLCVTLHHGEGMSHAEIAAALDLPLGTVKSHVARGTRKLRARMEAA